jgi:hypothetical protein
MPAFRILMAMAALGLTAEASAQRGGAGKAGAVPHAVRQSMVFETIAVCTVRRAPSATANLVLESGYVGGELRARLEPVMQTLRTCVSRDGQDLMRITPYLLRGELARALLLENVPAPRPYSAPTAADVAGQYGGGARAEQLAHAFATCVIDAAPEASLAFVRTLSGGPDEREAFSALRPAADGCAQEADRDLVLSGDRLRAALAIGLFGRTAIQEQS